MPATYLCRTFDIHSFFVGAAAPAPESVAPFVRVGRAPLPPPWSESAVPPTSSGCQFSNLSPNFPLTLQAKRHLGDFSLPSRACQRDAGKHARDVRKHARARARASERVCASACAGVYLHVCECGRVFACVYVRASARAHTCDAGVRAREGARALSRCPSGRTDGRPSFRAPASLSVCVSV